MKYASVALPNTGDGVQLTATGSNNRIGGSGAGDGNTIASNTGNGVAIFGTPAATGNAILGNRIYANRLIGIDLGTAAGSSGDGITANTGAKTSGQPNLLMNHPVFTTARARGNQLTVAGHFAPQDQAGPRVDCLRRGFLAVAKVVKSDA